MPILTTILAIVALGFIVGISYLVGYGSGKRKAANEYEGVE